MRQNTAYDLSLFENREKKRRLEVIRKEDVKETHKSAAQVAVKNAHIILAVALVFVLAMVMLRGKVSQHEKVSEISTYKQELESLVREETRLTSELEQKNSNRNIETFANEELGLIKLDNYQINYLSVSGTESVIIEKNNEGIGLFTFLENLFNADTPSSVFTSSDFSEGSIIMGENGEMSAAALPEGEENPAIAEGAAPEAAASSEEDEEENSQE